jgi:methylisocitrate lyase
VTLMSTVHALQANLQVLSERRTGDVDGLPSGQTTMPAFKDIIGWNAIEERQAYYEVKADEAEPALKRAA